MARTNTILAEDQILLFPQAPTNGEPAAGPHAKSQGVGSGFAARGFSVVICGTYRKDPEGLQRTFDHLSGVGFSILSPSNAILESERDGFVYMRHENTQRPDQIENKHLDAIQNADFVWLFAPGGYVGPSGALEVGFARASGVPVFSDTLVNDTTIKQFVQIVESPLTVHDRLSGQPAVPPPLAVKSFQHYYRRVALQRGYSRETAKDCLMLMVEEVGELARALRKRTKITRHGKEIANREALELADVFIYVVHMANILKIDLSKAVHEKELVNIDRLLNAK